MPRPLKISKHAYKRAKERFSWTKKTIKKMAEKAITEGINKDNSKGRLKEYIINCWRCNNRITNVFIYGENIYFFSKRKLVTIYRLPKPILKIKNQNVIT